MLILAPFGKYMSNRLNCRGNKSWFVTSVGTLIAWQTGMSTMCLLDKTQQLRFLAIGYKRKARERNG